MNGLGAGMDAAQQPQPEQQQAPEQQERGEPASPEEQAIYEQVMRNAAKVIAPAGEGEPTISESVLKSLKGSDNPVMNLATTASMLVRTLMKSAQANGMQIPNDVLFHAGADIVGLLAEVADVAKIHQYSDEDVERAFYLGLDMYRQAGTEEGDVDPEALKQEFGMIREADQSGNLEQVLPGISQRMKEAA